ncbi:hypothetical protein DAETH_48840 (plasmid) [Deinococcus aetherius]|uniref:Uncharacterized protein n=1 Tax=Deinococcus aetherius TaxID=200252 RepID=A0ABM8AM35_9DEIO|nr:DUF6176 family protein [Deinococcus aetherius]BDP44915.1 hypothetical protein DAETH_48840 [Deinococcus aetherius]
METRAYRIKLKPGSLERVRAWAAELTRRREEGLATLRAETVLLGCFFLEQTQDGDYLIAVATAERFEASRTAVEEALEGLDAYQQQFKKDTWASSQRLELLVELNRVHEGDQELGPAR